MTSSLTSSTPLHFERWKDFLSLFGLSIDESARTITVNASVLSQQWSMGLANETFELRKREKYEHHAFSGEEIWEWIHQKSTWKKHLKSLSHSSQELALQRLQWTAWMVENLLDETNIPFLEWKQNSDQGALLLHAIKEKDYYSSYEGSSYAPATFLMDQYQRNESHDIGLPFSSLSIHWYPQRRYQSHKAFEFLNLQEQYLHLLSHCYWDYSWKQARNQAASPSTLSWNVVCGDRTTSVLDSDFQKWMKAFIGDQIHLWNKKNSSHLEFLLQTQQLLPHEQNRTPTSSSLSHPSDLESLSLLARTEKATLENSKIEALHLPVLEANRLTLLRRLKDHFMDIRSSQAQWFLSCFQSEKHLQDPETLSSFQALAAQWAQGGDSVKQLSQSLLSAHQQRLLPLDPDFSGHAQPLTDRQQKGLKAVEILKLPFSPSKGAWNTFRDFLKQHRWSDKSIDQLDKGIPLSEWHDVMASFMNWAEKNTETHPSSFSARVESIGQAWQKSINMQYPQLFQAFFVFSMKSFSGSYYGSHRDSKLSSFISLLPSFGISLPQEHALNWQDMNDISSSFQWLRQLLVPGRPKGSLIEISSISSREDLVLWMDEFKHFESKRSDVFSALLCGLKTQPIHVWAHQINEIKDWIERSEQGIWERIPNKPTYKQLIRLQEDWHRLLKSKASDGSVLEWESLVRSSCSEDGFYRARALSTGFDLYEEGKVMHHCVSSYSSKAMKGQCRIFTVEKAVAFDDKGKPLTWEKQGTLELNPQNQLDSETQSTKVIWSVVQYRGRCNAQIQDPASWAFTEKIKQEYQDAYDLSIGLKVAEKKKNKEEKHPPSSITTPNPPGP